MVAAFGENKLRVRTNRLLLTTAKKKIAGDHLSCLASPYLPTLSLTLAVVVALLETDSRELILPSFSPILMIKTMIKTVREQRY
jgi:hypothetical protein